MLPSHHWAHDFKVNTDDIDYLINLLLEQETPLTSARLARVLIENRLAEETAMVKERFQDALIYNPSHPYQVKQRLLFPVFDYAAAVVTATRQGENDEYGDFSVLTVEFEDGHEERQFAAAFEPQHRLSEETKSVDEIVQNLSHITVDDVMAEAGDHIISILESHLYDHEALACVANQWFPVDLILELNDGHTNLVEAVLDLAYGGPLPPEIILDQIGGIGDNPLSLQVFSLNYNLNKLNEYVDVGPTGEVLWYLSRMAPAAVRQPPTALRYVPIDYDRRLLTDDMLTLEAEICDELTPRHLQEEGDKGKITLIYPHRRSGTLPLNANVRSIFPSAKTSHIWITLVDTEDGEEYTGWVVPETGYVHGLEALYAKHEVPIGAYVRVSQHAEPDKINISVNAYKPRVEWVHLMEIKGDQMRFEDKQRAIGIEYDDLTLLGIDDLDAIDDFANTIQKQKKSLTALLRMVIPELGRLTPQGTAHFITIYSAINVLRRCPPGPILATLEANPDFENVGGHYWKLAD